MINKNNVLNPALVEIIRGARNVALRIREFEREVSKSATTSRGATTTMATPGRPRDCQQSCTGGTRDTNLASRRTEAQLTSPERVSIERTEMEEVSEDQPSTESPRYILGENQTEPLPAGDKLTRLKSYLLNEMVKYLDAPLLAETDRKRMGTSGDKPQCKEGLASGKGTASEEAIGG